MNVPILRSPLTSDDIAALVNALKAGGLSPGEQTAAFESEFAKYLGVRDAVLLGSPAAALHAALVLAGVGEGSSERDGRLPASGSGDSPRGRHEVITTPFARPAVADAIVHAGAVPVFVDVDPETGLIDPDKVEAAVTERTRAILAVHQYGQMADVRRLRAVADAHALALIEDATDAVEAERDGARPGQLSIAAAFAFGPGDTPTAGQGSALATNREDLAGRVRLLRRGGVAATGAMGDAGYAGGAAGTGGAAGGSPSQADSARAAFGYGAEPTDFQAAALRNQFRRLDTMWAARKRLYERYAQFLRQRSVVFNAVLPGSKHAYRALVIRAEPERRDAVRRALQQAGVETAVPYPPAHVEPFYRQRFGYRPGTLPAAERLAAACVRLPLFAGLTDREQEHVIRKLVAALSVPAGGPTLVAATAGSAAALGIGAGAAPAGVESSAVDVGPLTGTPEMSAALVEAIPTDALEAASASSDAGGAGQGQPVTEDVGRESRGHHRHHHRHHHHGERQEHQEHREHGEHGEHGEHRGRRDHEGRRRRSGRRRLWEASKGKVFRVLALVAVGLATILLTYSCLSMGGDTPH